MTKFNDPTTLLQLLAILMMVNIAVSIAVGGIVLGNTLDVSTIKASRWTAKQQAEFKEKEFLPLKYRVEGIHPQVVP